MSNVINLTVKVTSDLTKLNTDLKAVGTQAKTTATNLKQTTTQLDQTGRSAQSLGQKVKGFGSQFGQTITNVGSLGGQVLNLSRQYQDLSDTQIRVDRSQLKLSRTNEAVTTAQTKLNDAVAKYGPNSAEAAKATLDLTQAQDAQKLATTLLGEALEDQQRANEDFWLGLAPTITTGIGTAMSAVKSFTGEKGLGGIKSAISGLTGAGGALSGLTSALSGFGGKTAEGIKSVATALGLLGGANVASGISGTSTALGGLSLAMKSVALAAAPIMLAIAGFVTLIKPFSLVIHEFSSAMKGDLGSMLDSYSSMIDIMSGKSGNFLTKLMQTFGPAGIAGTILESTGAFDAMKKEIEAAKQKIAEVGPASTTAKSGLEGIDESVNQIATIVDQFVPSLDTMIQGMGQIPPTADPAGTSLTNLGTGGTNAATGLDDVADSAPAATEAVGNFATITKFGLGEVKGGAESARMSINGVTFSAQELVNVMTTGHTNPFNQNLQQVRELADFATPSLDILTQAAAANAAQWQNSAGGMQIANASLKNLIKTMKTGAAAAVHLTNKIPYSKTLSGPRNPNYRLKSNYQPALIGSPQAQRQMLAGTRPKVQSKIRTKTAQGGMHEFLRQNTAIFAHKGEIAHIDKPSRMFGPGGSGGSGDTTITVRFIPEIFNQFLRYSINDNQGVMK